MKRRWMRIMAIGCAGAFLFASSELQVNATSAGSLNAGVFSAMATYMNTPSAQVSAAGVDTVTASGETGTEAVTEAATEIAASTETVTEAAEVAAPAETICGYTNLGIANVETSLNVRAEASEEAELVGKLPANAACEIVENLGEWYHIQSGEVDGYVKGEYLLTGDDAKAMAEQVMSTIATVTTETLYVREQPNTDCEVIAMMPLGEELEVTETLDGWVKIDLDGEEGYISSDYVTLATELPKAMTMTEVKYGQGVSDVRVSLVSFATQYVGNRYVWGGTSLTSGADCSGFVLSVYAQYGISLPHHAASQAGYGTKISASEAQPGDLFFYGSGRGINHVGIYIGNGQIVHASSPKTGIKISNAYYRSPVCVVRILD